MLRFMSTVACTVACSVFVCAQGEPAGGPVKVTRIVDTPQTRVYQTIARDGTITYTNIPPRGRP